MFKQNDRARLEAVLFAAGDPLSVAQIAEIMALPKPRVWELLSYMKEELSLENRGIILREVAGGYQLATKSEFDSMLEQLIEVQEQRITNASMETLAIVAFKQPVTRAEVEAIRGVKADSVLNTLMDMDLIEEAGRKEAVGRPILYATTDKFLLTFGINSLKDLPEMPDLALDEDLFARALSENEIESEDTDNELKNQKNTTEHVAPEGSYREVSATTDNEIKSKADEETEE